MVLGEEPESGQESPELNELTIDFLLLADRAEALNGKLYMMGAAWDRLTISNFEAASPISFALGILVPWNACNIQHGLAIDILDADHRSIGFHVEATFTAGRPADAIPGAAQRVIMAFPVVLLVVPRPGSYSVVAAINGVECKRTIFTVTGTPVPPGAPSQPPR